MNYVKLVQACNLFSKQAQQTNRKIVLDPKQKNIEFWSNFLYSAIKSYADKFRTPKNAQDTFANVANYLRAPAYASKQELDQLNQIEGALEEAGNKLKSVGMDPVEVLKKKGMTNVNPQILEILKSNLAVLKSGKDFSKYQHYYLVMPGAAHPKDVIELDENTDKTGY